MMKILLSVLIFGTCLLFYNNVPAQAPQIAELSPKDNAENVSLQVDLAIRFDQVQKGAGTVIIRRQIDDSIFEELGIDSDRILVFFNQFVQINPVNNLELATSYYVEVSEGAFESLSGEPFAGINDPTQWNFTTGCGQPPTGLSTSEITSTTVNLNWTAVAGVSNYEVYLGSRGIIDEAISGNSFILEGLAAETTDYVQIRNKCAESISSAWSSPVYFTTTACQLPTNLTVDEIGENSITFSWDDVPGVTGYKLWVKDVGVYHPTSNSFKVTKLAAGTSYTWSLRASCGEAFTKYVMGPEVTTTGSFCPRPSGLAVADVSVSSATLTWDAIPDASAYQVWVDGVGVFRPTTNRLEIAQIASGSSFKWSVKSTCTESFSLYTNGPQFSTSGATCNPPSGLSVVEISDTSAVFSWDELDNSTSYQVWVDGVGTFDVDVNSLTLNRLAPGTNYSWSVRSSCGESNTRYVTGQEFSTAGELCARPIGLAVNNITENSAILSWDAVPGVTEYQVWVDGVGILFPTTNNLALTGIASGTNYVWGVKSNCNGSYGQYTYGSQFSTSGFTCNLPSGLVVESITDSSAVLNWSMVDGASSYEVWINGIGRFTTVDNSQILTSLAPNTTYSWSVRTNCNNGYTKYVAGTPFTTSEDGSIIPVQDRILSDYNLESGSASPNSKKALPELISYPNPSSNEVHLSFKLASDDFISSVLVMNMQGEVVFNRTGLSSSSETLGLKQFGSGLYIIKVGISNKELIVKKIIIQ